MKSSNGYVIGYTAANEWLEYTVNVKQAGKYSYEATASSGADGSAFTIGLNQNGSIKSLAKVNVAKTANNSWDTYKTFSGTLSTPLEEGQQILRITINGAYCNIDKIKFECTEPSTGIQTLMSTASHQASAVYDLYGRKVSTMAEWQSLPHVLYIVEGKKIMR